MTKTLNRAHVGVHVFNPLFSWWSSNINLSLLFLPPPLRPGSLPLVHCASPGRGSSSSCGTAGCPARAPRPSSSGWARGGYEESGPAAQSHAGKERERQRERETEREWERERGGEMEGYREREGETERERERKRGVEGGRERSLAGLVGFYFKFFYYSMLMSVFPPKHLDSYYVSVLFCICVLHLKIMLHTTRYHLNTLNLWQTWY